MMTVSKLVHSCRLGAITCLLMSAAQTPALQARTDSNTISVAISNDIRSTNPGVGRDADTDTVLHHMVEALVAFDESLRVKPLLAKKIDISDDGLTYSFQLRSDLVFHNGSPVTSAEVAWSWTRYLDPKTGWKCRSWYVTSDKNPDLNADRSIISSITTPDPQTVVFKLAKPSPIFLSRMASVQCITAVLHPDSVDGNGDWIKPVGTGPFMLSEWKRGQYVELGRFPDYSNLPGETDGYVGSKPVKTEKVRFIVSPDPASVKAALFAGDLDIYPRVLMSSLPEIQKRTNITLLNTDTLHWSVLLINSNDVFFANPQIRRALAHAIDREQLSGFTTYSHAKVNSSVIPTADPHHSEKHDDWYAPDAEKSRALLKEAGYRGEVIRLKTNRKFPNMYENAIVLQAMMQNAGFNVRLDVADWASQLGDYYSGDYQLMAFTYSGLGSPLFRLSKLVGSKQIAKTRQWEHPHAIKLLSQLLATTNEAQLQKLYDQLHQLMKEDIPILGLYNSHSVIATRDTIKGLKAWPLDKVRLWGVSKASQTEQQRAASPAAKKVN